MMAGEDDQNDWFTVDPNHTGIIRNEGLTVPGFVSDADVLEVARETIVHLLFFHDAEKQVTRIFRDQLSFGHQLQEAAYVSRCAVAEVKHGIVDSLTEGLLHLLVAVSAEREVDGLI